MKVHQEMNFTWSRFDHVLTKFKTRCMFYQCCSLLILTFEKAKRSELLKLPCVLCLQYYNRQAISACYDYCDALKKFILSWMFSLFNTFILFIWKRICKCNYMFVQLKRCYTQMLKIHNIMNLTYSLLNLRKILAAL